MQWKLTQKEKHKLFQIFVNLAWRKKSGANKKYVVLYWFPRIQEDKFQLGAADDLSEYRPL